MPKKQPESKRVGRITSYLKGRGAYVFKTHGGDNPFQEAGLLDLYACYKGMFVGIEVKEPGNTASKLQEHHMQRIRDAGGLATVAYDVEDVASLLP